jgi:hypothetical protein
MQQNGCLVATQQDRCRTVMPDYTAVLDRTRFNIHAAQKPADGGRAVVPAGTRLRGANYALG